MGFSQENEVQVRISADDSALKPGMNGAATDVEKASERMRAAIANMNSEVSGHLSSMANAIGNVQGAISMMVGVLAGGSAFKFGIDETRKLTGEANGLAKALGISTTEASALNVALGDIYSSSEAFIGASQMLGRQLRTNEEALNAMGLKTRDANGEYRNMKDLMMDSIKVLNGYKEGTDRALAVQTMFGRGGAEVMSMLKLTKEGMEEARLKAEELGLTIGEGNVRAVREYKAAMNDLDDVMSAAKKAVGDELMPHLTELVNWLSSTGPDAVNALKSQIEILGTVAIGSVFTGAVRSMALRLADAATSLASTTQATRLSAAAKLDAAQAAARSTAAIKDHAEMLFREAEAAVASATGMARLTAVTEILIPARRNLEAATRSAMLAERELSDAVTSSSMVLQASGAVINALGGPIGAVITLLGLGATAWAAFGDGAKNAVDKANEEIEKGRAVLARYQREKKYGSGDEGQIRASLETVESKISILVQSAGSDAAKERLSALRKEAEELQSVLNDMETSKAAPDKGKGYVPPPEKKKAGKVESRMDKWDAELSAQKSAYMEQNKLYEMSLADEKKYWDEVLNRTDLSEKERGQVMKKSADLRLQILKKSAQEGRALAQEEIEEWKRDATNGIDIQQQAAEQSYALGQISKQEMLQMEQQFEQERYEIARQAVEDRMKLLEKDPNMNPVEYQKLKNQLLDIDRKKQLQKQAIENKIKLDQDAPGMNVFKTMESSFGSAITGMITRAQTLRQALGNIFGSILNSFITEFVAKKTAAWAMGLIRETALYQAFFGAKKGLENADVASTAAAESAKQSALIAAIAAKLGIETSGAAAGVAITEGESAAKISAIAPVAGANAAASQAGIPVIGPGLAFAAGAAMMAFVMSLGGKGGGSGVSTTTTGTPIKSGSVHSIPSAEGGWDIPAGATGLMRYHEREMMLPAEHADTIRSLGKDGGGGVGKDVNLHFHSADAQGVRRLLMDNKRVIAEALSSAKRDGFKS